MNKFVFMGRLTRDPEIRFGGVNNTCVAKFGLAVDRRFKREGEPTADFFNVTAFGRLGEFCEKYLKKGTKVVMEGEIRNDNYTDKEGRQVYGFTFVASSIEFAESKAASSQNNSYAPENRPSEPTEAEGEFMSIADNIIDELPFA